MLSHDVKALRLDPLPLRLDLLLGEQFLRGQLEIVRRHVHAGSYLLDALASVRLDMGEQGCSRRSSAPSELRAAATRNGETLRLHS